MKWIKRITLVLFALFAAGLAAVLVYFFALHPKTRAAPDVKAPSTPAAIARGKYLATHVTGCVGCHTPVDESQPGDPIIADKLLSGRAFNLPDFPGRLIAPNLTPDPTHGIGRWTDGELLRAMREGVDRDGHTLFPIMPYARFRKLTDADALAIIAYLRSVPPSANALPATEISFPVSMFIRLGPEPLTTSPPPWPTEPVARGKILLEVMSCIDCHTPIEKGELVSSLLYAGGNTFTGPFGTIRSPNITPDRATGIGAYTDDELMRVFREGKARDGRPLYVMPWSLYRGADEADLRALIAALRTLPPIPHGPQHPAR